VEGKFTTFCHYSFLSSFCWLTEHFVGQEYCLFRLQSSFHLPPYSALKVKSSLFLTKHHAMKMDWGSGDIRAFFDLDTRWMWVVSFTLRSLYPEGKSPRYPLDRRLDGTQSRSGRGGEEKNSQLPPAFEPRSDSSARSQSLYWLS
jgi:hypothetical protein